MALGSVIGEAFVDIRPAFQKFAGELTTGVTKATDAASREGSKHFEQLAGVGKAAFLGIAGAAVIFGGAAIKAAIEGQKSTAQLANAVKNAGGDFEALDPKIHKLTEGFAKFGYENDQAEAALARLVQITGDTKQSMDLLSTAANLAAARHIDLTTAANLVGRAAEGNITPLKKMGIQIADTGTKSGNARAAIEALNERFGGAAQAQAETYAGKLAAFKATMSNLTEEVGNFLLPKLALLAGGLADTVGFFEHNEAAAIALGIAVGGPLAVAMAAYIVQQGIVVGLKIADFFETAAIATLYMVDALKAAAIATYAALGPVGLLAAGVAALALWFDHAQKSASEAAKAFASEYLNSVRGSSTETEQLSNRIADLLIANGKIKQSYQEQSQVIGGSVQTLIATDKQYQANAAQINKYKDRLTELKTQQAAGNQASKDHAAAIGETGDAAAAAAPSIADLADKYGVEAAAVSDLATKMKIDLSTATADQARALEVATARLADTSAASVTLRDALGKLADKTSDATQKTQAFRTALDLLIGGNIDADRAVVTFEGSIDGLGAKLRASKLSFDAHTQAGRDNISAIQDAVVAARSHIEALQAQGAGADALRGALASDTEELRKQLVQAGFTTAQIDALIQKYGLVPSSVETVISANGSQAENTISVIKQKFADLVNILEAPLQVFVSPPGKGSSTGEVRVRRVGRGDFFPGNKPELAIVGDSREVMLPLDDPRRMAEILAKAGVGGRASAPPAIAATPAAGPLIGQLTVDISMPGLATSPEARKLIEETARGEFEWAVGRALDAASAGTGARGG